MLPFSGVSPEKRRSGRVRTCAWGLVAAAAALIVATSAYAVERKGAAGQDGQVGIEERLGEFVPLDTVFVDEQGRDVMLSDLVDRPTVLALAYYNCTNVCPDLLVGTADVIGRSEAVPGKDYRVITVSFDDRDTPVDAARKKDDYLSAASDGGREVGEGDWRFLTGGERSIRSLTDSLGFRFRGKDGGFLHPASLIVISAEGRVTRYLFGTRFKPFDIDMALSEASDGRVGPSIPRVARICFTYDPEKKTYAFDFLKIGGGTILFAAGGFALFVAAGRKRRGRRRR